MSLQLKITCPICRTAMKVSDKSFGATVCCQDCGAIFGLTATGRITAPAATPPGVAETPEPSLEIKPTLRDAVAEGRPLEELLRPLLPSPRTRGEKPLPEIDLPFPPSVPLSVGPPAIQETAAAADVPSPPALPLMADVLLPGPRRALRKEKSGGKKPRPWLLALGGIAAGLLLAFGSAGLVVLLRSVDPASQSAPNENRAAAKVTSNENDPAPETTPRAPDSFNLAVVRKSVVFIKTIAPGFPPVVGSGFIVNQDGMIATNRQVVRATDEAVPGAIYLVGVPSAADANVLDFFKAEEVYCPPRKEGLDLALLKITAAAGHPRFLAQPLARTKADLGASVAALGYDELKENQPVFSFSSGRITAGKVEFDGKGHYQTDAVASSGHCGGPLVNAQGEMIGMVAFKQGSHTNATFALCLDETGLPDIATAKSTGVVRPEPGPLDPARLPGPKTIAPRAANWQIVRGEGREQPNSLVIDGNGDRYWLTSKETLPEHFQMLIRCHLEFLQGKQPVLSSEQISQRTLCLRVGTADADRDILDGNGLSLHFSQSRMLLWGDNNLLNAATTGNPESSFVLTLTRRGPDVTVAVNGKEILRQVDPVVKRGGHRFSIGGYLSRLHLAQVSIANLDDTKSPGPGRP